MNLAEKSLESTFCAGLIVALMFVTVDVVFSFPTYQTFSFFELFTQVLNYALIGVAFGTLCAVAALLIRTIVHRALPSFEEAFFAPFANAPSQNLLPSIIWFAVAIATALLARVIFQSMVANAPDLWKWNSVIHYIGFFALVFVAFSMWLRKSARSPSFWAVVIASTVVVQNIVLNWSNFVLRDLSPLLIFVAGVVASVAISVRVRPPRKKFIYAVIPIAIASGFFQPLSTNTHAGLSSEFTFPQPMVKALSTISDLDSDGYGAWFDRRDCAPFDSSVHPNALEVPNNDVDENCTGGDTKAEPRTVTTSFDATNASQPLNVVLITIDTLRHDAVPRMKNLKKFAESSSYFPIAISPSTQTHESLPSLFTGNYPSTWTQQEVFFGNEPTLAGVLSSNDFQTFAAVATPVVWSSFLEGFETVWNAKGAEANFTATSEAVVDKAIQQIDARDPHRPFFSWIHLYDPHALHFELDGFDSELLYWHDVERTDRALGRLFENLLPKLEANTIFVVTSDHGEGLGQHGLLTHVWKGTLPVVGVPLVIKTPETSPKKIETVVSLVDVAPTILEAQNISVTRDGRSLLEGTKTGNIDPRPIFFEATSHDPILVGVVDGSFKLWFDWMHGTYFLNDFQSDPDEKLNLLSTHPEVFQRLQKKLWGWRDQQVMTTRLELIDEAQKAGRISTPKLPKNYEGPPIEPSEVSIVR